MKITVLGAGAWGTAFGQVLADAGNDVEPEIVEGIRDRHHNAVRLPSVERLPENMTATGDRAEAVRGAEIIIVSIAAQAARVALEPFRDLIPGDAIVVSLMKGIERATGKRMDEVVTETLGLPEDRFAAIRPPPSSPARTSTMRAVWPMPAPRIISRRSSPPTSSDWRCADR